MGIAIGSLLGLLLAISIVLDVVQTNKEKEILANSVGGMETITIYEGYSNNKSKKDTFTYYREITTDVMYICYEEYRKGSLTVMLDSETGLPLTYSRYLELINENTKGIDNGRESNRDN